MREHRTSPSARAYALLSPYAGLPVIGSLGVVCFGSVEHPLGMAALTMGDLDLAVRHLRAAVQANLALSRIAGVDPVIGEELRASVQTGLRCCYRPR
ncbi:hypothetical protein AB0L44_27425 [Nonomuraea wenchangensis]|uniref:hypothetical protein n=1 Tax=Nonomuraea wenchangensis TaxID=568860 RepID=UPI00342C88D2